MSSQSSTQPLAGDDPGNSDGSPSRERRLSPESLLAGRYQIFKVLGQGGFGVTYLARNVYLPGQPLCVIKHLAPKFTNPALLTIAKWRFYVEARTLSQLGSHSQIPLLLDYFRKDGEMYLVQEYIPGATIFSLVRESQTFTESQVQDFLAEMLQLLNYIHSHRLIHRDLKPQNIIRCQTDNRLVLIDFGAVSDQEGTRLSDTRLAKAVGTPGYAPPEQISQRPVYASDLYALGMTCIFMLTGREPMSWPMDPQTGEVIWRSDTGVSDSFAKILNRMIHLPLTDRYHSAIQVTSALHNQRLYQKLIQYTSSKTALNTLSGDLEETRVNYLPPAVQWAIQISSH